MENVTGTRTEIIVSGYVGKGWKGKSYARTTHAPRRFEGRYVRRYGWRVTVCGQIAEAGWEQRIRYGYITCRVCIRLLERRAA